MKKYVLNSDQESFLTQSFLMIPPQDGMQASLEFITNAIAQCARKLVQATPHCPEQIEAVKYLRNAEHWFHETIKKHGDF